jgi:hypothetical protein
MKGHAGTEAEAYGMLARVMALGYLVSVYKVRKCDGTKWRMQCENAEN